MKPDRSLLLIGLGGLGAAAVMYALLPRGTPHARPGVPEDDRVIGTRPYPSAKEGMMRMHFVIKAVLARALLMKLAACGGR